MIFNRTSRVESDPWAELRAMWIEGSSSADASSTVARCRDGHGAKYRSASKALLANVDYRLASSTTQ